jgi:nucleolar protein 9
VPLDSSEFHATKTSTVLAARLNLGPPVTYETESQHGFPDLLKFVVSEMLNAASKNMRTLQVDQYSSLVLQTALKMLAGHDNELLRTIPLLLGCKVEHSMEGNLIEKAVVKNLLSLMKETSFSHLMEVILEVSPDTLYSELITKVFKNSIFEMSSHPCGNFVIQALISHARTESHMDLIWDELGTKFNDLLGMGRSGVVGSLIAASQKLHTHEHKCCQALAAAVTSGNESSKDVVPRILFIDNYFWCVDKSNWNWPKGAKMNVVGSLILQSVFGLPNEFIQAYVTSITSMEAEHLLEALKDSRGARVIEAFLLSNASGKLKRKLIMKLRGHFGELAMHPAGSFTVDKCYTVSNVSLREIIVSELLAVQTDLSKTRHGPYLMKNFDVDGFSRRPEQWKKSQASTESVKNQYKSEFGSKESKSSKKVRVVSEQPKDEMDTRRVVSSSSQFIANPASTSFTKPDSKHPAAPTQLSDKPSKSKRRKKDGVSKS